jgi:outer membrane protein
MRSLRIIALLAIPAQLASAHFAFAQQTPIGRGEELTLDQAIESARQNNPGYLQVKNNLRDADAAVRTAHGMLFPSLSANAGSRYTQAGTQYQFGVPFTTQPSINSQYGLSLNYNISAGLAFAPRAAKADRAAATANIANSSESVRATITQQYITALQAEATAAVSDTLVTVAQGQLDLANAKMAVGAGTIIDVRAAEVAVGQAQVTALTQHNLARVNKLELFQTMGVAADIDAKLTTKFSIEEPRFSLDSLLDLARRVNPDLAAKKSLKAAADANVQYARTNYLPTLNLQTGYTANALGYTNSDILVQQKNLSLIQNLPGCLRMDSLRTGAGLSAAGCQTSLTPAQESAARSQNHPFSFSGAPITFSAFLSIPIFNNFQREQAIEQNKVTRDNATLDVQARNLQVTHDVTQAYLNLVTAEKTTELQTQTAAKAAEDLALNQESYKVGAKTFLDVTTANATYQQAEINRINSIYDYHKAFAALENAVGRPLR